MKHWQEKRNYQHVRDEAGNVRSNIITVDGIDVEVSDEVYWPIRSSTGGNAI